MALFLPRFPKSWVTFGVNRVWPCKDEGVGHRRKPVLQISFGPLLAIGEAALHRLFLLTTCPSKLYSKYNKGMAAGNRVLDRLLRAVGQSLRTAYYRGIDTPHGTFFIVCLGLAGDHIFQTKAYRCARHHTCNSICPHCLANTTTLPFEDVDVGRAMWVDTTFRSMPWRKPPPLGLIPGGDWPSFIRFDLMHVLPHGCGRTFVASMIAMMCGPLKLFPGESKAARLEEAYEHFSFSCEKKHMYPRDMQEFTADNLGWKFNRDFPECNCKAMDCNMMIQWCIDFLSSTPLCLEGPLLWAYKGCCGFDNFCRLCYRSMDRIFWTREEARQGYSHLRDFVRAYKALAVRLGAFQSHLTLVSFLSTVTRLSLPVRYWHDNGWCLFNITPKLHYATHWLLELHVFLQSQKTLLLSPGAFATPLMEDFIGLTSKISRTSHPSSVALTTMRKYLVEVRRAWREKMCCPRSPAGISSFL